MTDHSPTDDARTLWRGMPVEAITLSAEEMRGRARAFEARIRRRNLIEHIACAAVAAIFLWYAAEPAPHAPLLWPAANIVVALGALLVAVNLHRNAAAKPAPAAASAEGLTAFHRAELVRQRDALRSVGRWYLLPFAPGMALWFAAAWMNRPPEGPALVMGAALAVVAGVAVAVALMVLKANHAAADDLQRQIDEADRWREAA